MAQRERAPVRRFRPSSRQALSRELVRAISDIEGVSPLDLPPLGHVVDFWTLDTLVFSTPDHLSDVEQEFTYCGYRVVIEDSRITIYEE